MNGGSSQQKVCNLFHGRPPFFQIFLHLWQDISVCGPGSEDEHPAHLLSNQAAIDYSRAPLNHYMHSLNLAKKNTAVSRTNETDDRLSIPSHFQSSNIQACPALRAPEATRTFNRARHPRRRDSREQTQTSRKHRSKKTGQACPVLRAPEATRASNRAEHPGGRNHWHKRKLHESISPRKNTMTIRNPNKVSSPNKDL